MPHRIGPLANVPGDGPASVLSVAEVPSHPDFAPRPSHTDADLLDSWAASYQGSATPAAFFREPPSSARPLAPALPEVGTDFVGFQLVAELGRGAFGRVFLGHQNDLAGRPVALKVSTEIVAESQRLARLQHTNIVPIYSFHRQGPLQAVCMPYFGSATLGDVLADLGRRPSLPESGKAVVGTVCDRRGRTRRDVESRSASAPAAAAPSAAKAAASVLPESGAAEALKALEGKTYVEAILWMAARLADGLAHAHERGILHRDLKPANVLLTDDGQPMLLDFNLSEDTQRPDGAAAAQVGGTLPYMAPEHLEAFSGVRQEVDARADLYGLGVILYELLTGRHPFSKPTGAPAVVLPQMIAERRKTVPGLCGWNPAVTPAAEAIVRKLLAADPAQRYQSAADLREDLERQLAHRPLRHQAEPSARERARKWVRRHSWVKSTAFVAAASLAVIVGLATTAFATHGRLERAKSITQLADFRADAGDGKVLMASASAGLAVEAEGRAKVRRALERYAILDGVPWEEQPAVRALPEAERARLQAEAGELLLLLTASLAPSPRADDREEARRLNRLAELCYGGGSKPRALWAQRADLATDEAEARRLRLEAGATPFKETWDQYLLARELARQGRLYDALKQLREVVARDPSNYAAWFLLGNCHLEGFSDNPASRLQAVGHFTSCVTLRPDFYAPYFNRGLAYYEITKFAEAEADFTKALELKPDLPSARLWRALAREHLKKFREAMADLDEEIARDGTSTQAWLARSRLHVRLGDKVAAARDRAEGLRRTPADEMSWIARGLARATGLQPDMQGALDDFAEAAKLNPTSRHVLQNQAVMLLRLNRHVEALKAFDRLVGLYPDFVSGRAWRAVQQARLGRRAEALAEVGQALLRDPGTGEILYQAANVYSLLSRAPDDPDGDRREALRLLATALRRGYGYDVLDRDGDLDPLRDDESFKELARLAAATEELSSKK